jgi:hypothetical protein
MPKKSAVTLTKRTVDALRAPRTGDRQVFDAELRGVLAFASTRAGKKVFFVPVPQH